MKAAIVKMIPSKDAVIVEIGAKGELIYSIEMMDPSKQESLQALCRRIMSNTQAMKPLWEQS